LLRQRLERLRGSSVDPLVQPIPAGSLSDAETPALLPRSAPLLRRAQGARQPARRDVVGWCSCRRKTRGASHGHVGGSARLFSVKVRHGARAAPCRLRRFGARWQRARYEPLIRRQANSPLLEVSPTPADRIRARSCEAACATVPREAFRGYAGAERPVDSVAIVDLGDASWVKIGYLYAAPPKYNRIALPPAVYSIEWGTVFLLRARRVRRTAASETPTTFAIARPERPCEAIRAARRRPTFLPRFLVFAGPASTPPYLAFEFGEGSGDVEHGPTIGVEVSTASWSEMNSTLSAARNSSSARARCATDRANRSRSASWSTGVSLMCVEREGRELCGVLHGFNSWYV
jgi:hypothetical protein